MTECSIMYRMPLPLGKAIKSTNRESTGKRTSPDWDRERTGLECDPVPKFRMKLNMGNHIVGLNMGTTSGTAVIGQVAMGSNRGDLG